MSLYCQYIAMFMLENNLTIREAAKYFRMSKSRIHYILNNDLKSVNNSLYLEIRKLLDANWKDRNRRGGLALQRKYRESKRFLP